jgi:hypothetical protein
MTDVIVKALKPELHDDLMRFFDFSAYADNPHWASCFCTFFLSRSGDEHSAHTKEQNRATRGTVIRSGTGNGLIAFRLGRVVGWCHAAPKSELLLLASWDPKNASETEVGAVVCFVVAPDARPAGRRDGAARRGRRVPARTRHDGGRGVPAAGEPGRSRAVAAPQLSRPALDVPEGRLS